MTRRRFIQINGELVEVSLDYQAEPRAAHHVMPDIEPYQSMIDGKQISSRSHHREHLRMHGCIEVGNDSSLGRWRGPLKSPSGLKEMIARNVYSKLRY